LNSHLSRSIVAGGLKPPPESGRAGLASSKRCSPAVLLRIEFTAAYCLQPPGELLPRLSTLTLTEDRRQRTGNSQVFVICPLASALCKAVYLCCTGPKVAFGGRYPLSLPCGARTFLVSSLSPVLRGCPAYSLCYSKPDMYICQPATTQHLHSYCSGVTVQGQPPNVAQPASMHWYCGENLEYWSKLVCKTPADPHFSAAPEL